MENQLESTTLPPVYTVTDAQDAVRLHTQLGMPPPNNDGGRSMVRTINIALTFVGPRVQDWTRQSLMDLCLSYPHCESAVVAREPSQNGAQHFHVFMRMKTARRITVKNLEEHFKVRPHVSSSNTNWLVYITKNDTQFLVDGKLSRVEVLDLVQRAVPNGVAARLANELRTRTPEELIEDPVYASYVTHHWNAVKSMAAALVQHRNAQAKLAKIEAWKPLDETQFYRYNRAGKVNHDVTICRWLNFIMSLDPMDIPKKCHLWIYGSTNTGKTRFASMLEKKVSLFAWNKHKAGWQDDYPSNSRPHVMYIDEMSDATENGFTIPLLNELLDGKKKIDQRHKPSLVRDYATPTLVFSNIDPEYLFIGADPELKTAFLGRFTLIPLYNKRPNEEDPMSDPDQIHVFHEEWRKLPKMPAAFVPTETYVPSQLQPSVDIVPATPTAPPRFVISVPHTPSTPQISSMQMELNDDDFADFEADMDEMDFNFNYS
jgi:hypothetical protein